MSPWEGCGEENPDCSAGLRCFPNSDCRACHADCWLRSSRSLSQQLDRIFLFWLFLQSLKWFCLCSLSNLRGKSWTYPSHFISVSLQSLHRRFLEDWFWENGSLKKEDCTAYIGRGEWWSDYERPWDGMWHSENNTYGTDREHRGPWKTPRVTFSWVLAYLEHKWRSEYPNMQYWMS